MADTRCEIELLPLGVLLQVNPKRGSGRLSYLPALTVIVCASCYKTTGQQPLDELIGGYVFAVLLLAVTLWGLFGTQRVLVGAGEVCIYSGVLWLKWSRSYAIRDVEWLDYDRGGSESSPSMQMKLEGKMLLITFANGITEQDATSFLIAIRSVLECVAADPISHGAEVLLGLLLVIPEGDLRLLLPCHPCPCLFLLSS
jgi:hypothetical protein